MGFVQGEGRTQGTLFPVCLEELIPDDHVCRVIDAFVGRLDMAGLGVWRAQAARPWGRGVEPRPPLKLSLCCVFPEIPSPRATESGAHRNNHVVWSLRPHTPPPYTHP